MSLLIADSSWACGHNYLPDSFSSAGYFEQVGTKYKRVEYISGKIQSGKKAVKIYLVPKGSHIKIKKLSKKDMEILNQVTAVVAGIYGTNALGSGIDIHTQIVGSKSVQYALIEKSYPDLFSILMKKFKFSSNHEAQMNKNLKNAILSGWSVFATAVSNTPGKESDDQGVSLDISSPIAYFPAYLHRSKWKERYVQSVLLAITMQNLISSRQKTLYLIKDASYRETWKEWSRMWTHRKKVLYMEVNNMLLYVGRKVFSKGKKDIAKSNFEDFHKRGQISTIKKLKHPETGNVITPSNKNVILNFFPLKPNGSKDNPGVIVLQEK